MDPSKSLVALGNCMHVASIGVILLLVLASTEVEPFDNRPFEVQRVQPHSLSRCVVDPQCMSKVVIAFSRRPYLSPSLGYLGR